MADEAIGGSGSAERVALDLASRIHHHEQRNGAADKPDTRTYWLKLYSDCIKTVRNGYPPKE